MKVLNAEQTADLLPYPEVAREIEHVLKLWRSGEVTAPDRIYMPLPEGGTYLAMPAGDADYAICKTASVHPGNSALGLPTIQGHVSVLDARVGTPLLLLDGAMVTTRRTAALSLLGAWKLDVSSDDAILIVGGGAQGHAHVEAYVAGLGTKRFFISSRRPESAETLAGHARSLGAEATAVSDVAEALGQARVITTCSTSKTPVLPESLADDTVLIGVGAYLPSTAEIPPGVVGRSTVLVDTLAGTRRSAGDLLQAVEAGTWDWDRAIELVDAPETFDPGGPRIFKSVGHAVFDLAAARVAVTRSG